MDTKDANMLGLAYKDTLPTTHRQALWDGSVILIDTCLSEIKEAGEAGWSVENSILETLLPAKYRHKYTPRFLQDFLMCIITVSWKLAQYEPYMLSCVAEGLAAHAIIKEAIGELELHGVEPNFGSFEDALFEDVDFETLFDPAYDGIEDSEAGKKLGIVNLAFKDWFKRFGEGEHSAYTEIHPFAQSYRRPRVRKSS